MDEILGDSSASLVLKYMSSDMEEGYTNLRILTTGVRWMEDYLTDADVFQKYANDYVYYRNWIQHIEDNQPIQQS